MTNKVIKEDITKYVNMSHSIQFREDEDGFVVFIPDLPGCISQGDTIEEAYSMIKEAKYVWIESALEDGETIPEPSEDKKYSGKILLRIPHVLHAELSKMASLQGSSLNQYLIFLLTKENEKVELHFHKTNEYNIEKIEVQTSPVNRTEVARY